MGASETKTPARGRGCQGLNGRLGRSLGHPDFRQDIYVEPLLRAPALKLHLARHFGEERVIGPDTDVGAGTHRRAPLTDEDIAGEHLLASEALHAESLGMGIAAVLGAAASLFMCHVCLSPR